MRLRASRCSPQLRSTQTPRTVSPIELLGAMGFPSPSMDSQSQPMSSAGSPGDLSYLTTAVLYNCLR